MCALDTARGRVHIVRASAMVELPHESFLYKVAALDHLRTSTEWQNDLFCVNRFFRKDHMHYKVNE